MKKVTPEFDFAGAIKQRRVSLGMTQSQCSQLAGIDPGGWSYMENHATTNQLSLVRAAKIAAGVGLALILVPIEDVQGS